jgi:hypothetical protein
MFFVHVHDVEAAGLKTLVRGQLLIYKMALTVVGCWPKRPSWRRVL